MKRILALLCCLAGCSGGGSGATAPPVPSESTFNALRAESVRFDVSYLASLPATGVADYRGLVRMDLPLAPAPAVPYYGNLAMQVDFGGGPQAISGRMSDFQGPGGVLTGDLQISNGMIHSDASQTRDYQFDADLAGALAQNGQSYPVSARLSGDFRGATGEAMTGAIYRGMIGQGDSIDSFHGAFAAQRVPSGG